MWTASALLLLMPAGSQAQAVLPEITPRIETAKRWAQILSEAAGTPVKVSTPLEDKNIYFAESGIALRVALDGIAKCLHATVSTTKSGYLISRTEVDIAQARTTSRRAVEQWLTDKMDAVRKFRGSSFGSGRVDAAVQASVAQYLKWRSDLYAGKGDHSSGMFPQLLLPPEELLEGLIERIGLDKIASIPSGTTAIFEDQPIPGAKPLPKHDDLLDLYSSRVEKAGRVMPPTTTTQQELESVIGADYLSYPDGATLKADRLRLSCSVDQKQVGVTLEGFDLGGNLNLRATFMAGPTNVLHHPLMLTREALVDPKSIYAPLSTASVKALEYLENVDYGSRDKVFGPNSWISDPTKKDPLDFWVKDAFDYVCSQHPQRCFAAELPDSLWVLTRECATPKGLCMTSWARAMNEWLPTEALKSADIYVIRPVDIVDADAEQTNRNVLRRYAALNTPIQDTGIRNVAKLVADAARRNGEMAWTWFFACDTYHQVDPEIQRSGEHFLRLLAGISDADWAKLMSGSSATADQLGVSDALRGLLTVDQTLTFNPPIQVPGLYQHPLEVLGFRNVGDCLVSGEGTQTTLYSVIRKGAGRWCEASELSGNFHVPFTGPGTNGEPPKILMSRDQFEAQEANTILVSAPGLVAQISIQIAPGATIEKRWRESLGAHSEPVRFSDLSQEMRDAIWNQAVERALALAKTMHQLTSTTATKASPP